MMEFRPLQPYLPLTVNSGGLSRLFLGVRVDNQAQIPTDSRPIERHSCISHGSPFQRYLWVSGRPGLDFLAAVQVSILVSMSASVPSNTQIPYTIYQTREIGWIRKNSRKESKQQESKCS